MFNKKVLPINTPEIIDNPDNAYYGISYEKFDENTLIINIFKNSKDDKGRFSPAYRVFQRKDEYLTYKYDEKKWSNASIGRLTLIEWYLVKIDEKTEAIVESFIGLWNIDDSESTSIRKIIELQNSIMEKKRVQRFKKEAAEIDREMEKFAKLPKGINKFFTKTVFLKENFIFYNKKNGSGYCTNCECTVTLSGKYKHNMEGCCPICKKPITFKADGISHKHLQTFGTGVIFKRKNKELLVRYFDITKDYGEDYKNPKVSIFETVRTVLNQSGFTNYEWRLFHQTTVRWCKCMPHQNYYWYNYDVRYVSHSNFSYYGLTNAINGTCFEHSEVMRYMQRKRTCAYSAENYLCKYIEHPVTEKFLKLGMFDIAEYCIMGRAKSLNESESELHKILGINKQQLKVLRSVTDPKYDFYLCIKENNTNKVYNAEQYALIMQKCVSLNNCRKMYELLTVYSYKKVMKYLENNNVAMYLDYIDFCKKLEYDITNSFVAFPKNLQVAHDDAQSLITEKERKKEIDAINKLLPQIAERYNFRYKDLVVMAPSDGREYIAESQALHNCISQNYMGTMAKAKCVIVFIRKADDINKPYYAMEISDGKIVQVEGKNHCKMNPEVEECVEAFKKTKLAA